MRREQTINLLYWLAAAALAGALIVAPSLLPAGTPHQILWALFAGGTILAVVLVAIAVALAVKDEEAAKRVGKKKPVSAILGMVVFGLGFLGCAGWYFWPTQKPPVTTKAKADFDSLLASKLNNRILLECSASLVPELIPPDGYYELGISNNGSGPWMGSILAPGTKNPAYQIDRKQAPLAVCQCRLTNLGNEPVINVTAALNIAFSAGGKVARALEIVQTPQVSLGVHNQNTAHFYVRNYSKFDVYVSGQGLVRGQLPGSPKEDTAYVIPARNDIIPIDAWEHAQK